MRRLWGTYSTAIVAIFGFSLLCRTWFISRFEGRWLDSDTSWLTRFADAIWSSKTLFPTHATYSNGFGYPFFVGFAAQCLGISVRDFQTLVQPLVGVVFLGAAAVLLQTFVQGRHVQAVALFLVASAPELFFETVRASHAAFTFSAIMITVATAARASRNTDNFRWKWVAISLVSAWGAALLNIFFGLLLVAVLLGFVGLSLFDKRTRASLRNRALAGAAAGALALLILVPVTYPPAIEPFTLGKAVADPSVAPVFVPPSDAPAPVGNQRTSQITDSFSYVRVAWHPTWLYFVLTLWNLSVVPLGAFVVLRTCLTLLPRWAARRPDVRTLEAAGLWLILFFGTGLAFMAATRTGGFGSNLHLRVFSLFSVAAALVAAIGIKDWVWPAVRRRGKPAIVMAVVLLVVGGIAGPMKSMADPTFNHHWLFYSDSEEAALRWIGTEKANVTIWAGADDAGWENRFFMAFVLANSNIRTLRLDWGEAPPIILRSEITERHAGVNSVAIPDSSSYFVAYHADDARILVNTQD